MFSFGNWSAMIGNWRPRSGTESSTDPREQVAKEADRAPGAAPAPLAQGEVRAEAVAAWVKAVAGAGGQDGRGKGEADRGVGRQANRTFPEEGKQADRAARDAGKQPVGGKDARVAGGRDAACTARDKGKQAGGKDVFSRRLDRVDSSRVGPPGNKGDKQTHGVGSRRAAMSAPLIPN
jgi:hypothetical protein